MCLEIIRWSRGNILSIVPLCVVVTRSFLFSQITPLARPLNAYLIEKQSTKNSTAVLWIWFGFSPNEKKFPQVVF